MKLDLTISETEDKLFRILYSDVRRRILREVNAANMSPSLIECLLILYFKFLVANGHRFKYMTGKQLANLYHIYFNMPDFDFIEEIISYINPTVRNGLSAEGFIKLVEIWAFSNLEQKMKFCFAIYTYRDPRGVITRNRLKKLCRNMIYMESLEDSYDLLNEDYESIVTRNPRLLEFAGRVMPDITRLYETIGDMKQTSIT
ncbi:uncharacterized protein LOC119653826 isoform X2 [Hermetia illucens]|uniref:uncharacterized protein LOC119653826 isoform X2 n=1 Tax=Hermetia illucens TaxID=343691 RepID=UPI0018CC44CA|nr:uncharacterized protein LOC119653826 isoform X2 [Hermetia illucens]